MKLKLCKLFTENGYKELRKEVCVCVFEFFNIITIYYNYYIYFAILTIFNDSKTIFLFSGIYQSTACKIWKLSNSSGNVFVFLRLTSCIKMHKNYL